MPVSGRRPRDRAADPASGAAAGPGAALGAAGGAASHPKREQLLGPLAEAMKIAEERIRTCSTCGNVDTRDPCTICADPRRDAATLVVVESVGDLWALERAGATRGLYHVLGGALSPLDGVGPEDLTLDRLVARVAEGGVVEVVLAVNATVDGQTTAHYITDLLAPYSSEDNPARAWRARRRRVGLSRRRHLDGGDAAANGVLRPTEASPMNVAVAPLSSAPPPRGATRSRSARLAFSRRSPATPSKSGRISISSIRSSSARRSSAIARW